MHVNTRTMLEAARNGSYAVGAFNIYNMEGALAVIRAAERQNSPVILQLLPRALKIGGSALMALCRRAVEEATIPAAVQLDHCHDQDMLLQAMEMGFSTVMVDGSQFDLEKNMAFTGAMTERAHALGVEVEAELGRITGYEDGEGTVCDQLMTDPEEAGRFVRETGVDALAVCIGNIHGKYHHPPRLDFQVLKAIAEVVEIPLVLHGTSGLPDEIIEKAVGHGVAKFNVNTEVRHRYIEKLRQFSGQERVELVEVIEASIAAMMEPIEGKMVLFGSSGKALAKRDG